MTIDVLIPTLRAASTLPELIAALRRQTMPPRAIRVIDSTSEDDTAALAERHGCRVEVIARTEFSHGATRNRAALGSDADILVFMTQDARPVDHSFLELLTQRLRAGEAVASYARQVPWPGAPPIEKFNRQHNYPAIPQVRSSADPDRTGYRRYYFSNVASAVLRPVFVAAGGFPDCITFEDMALCAKLLHAGHAVAYAAEARVWHSHDYALREVFRRYFDAGVFFATAKDLLRGAHTRREGLTMLRSQIGWLWRQGHARWIPRALAEAGAKVVAFQMGKRHRLLPSRLVRRCTALPAYWSRAR